MLRKRSMLINGRKTSVSVVDVFWEGVREIARSLRTSIASLVATIDRRRGDNLNLSSAIRIEVMTHFRSIAMTAINDESASMGARSDPGARQQARRRNHEDAGLLSLARRRMQRQTATLHETIVSSDTTGQISKERMERAIVAMAYIVAWSATGRATRPHSPDWNTSMRSVRLSREACPGDP